MHGFIADALGGFLNVNSQHLYSFYSLRNDAKGGEKKIKGRYIEKQVDIAIFHDDKPTAGIGFKFVMSNYAQNSNNYFENMLGEAANIRCNSLEYFQILVLIEKMPYYDKDGTITQMEQITMHNLEKYIVLSNDNSSVYFHTPKKTLLYIVKPKITNENLSNKDEYRVFYQDKDLVTSDMTINFGNGIIFNDFETFIKKVGHTIESI